MGLSVSQMRSLLADNTGAGNLALVNGVWQDSKLTATTVGAFEGKQGTVTRNRKGVTRIKANGSRYFNDVDATVQAYMAAKVVK